MKNAIVIIDMQNDFVRPTGKLPVDGAEAIIPTIQKIIRYAREKGGLIIYTVDQHSKDDPEFDIFPEHCVKGTTGADIVSELTPMEGDIIIPKSQLSAWSNPKCKRIFNRYDINKVAVCGVATEYCVKAFVVDSGYHVNADVNVVVDAIAGVNPADSAEALMVMGNGGAYPYRFFDNANEVKT